jgi:D-tyrosyl-tRNA(Tyr) deacylase
MKPEPARQLFQTLLDQLRALHPRVASGFFQEHMEVDLLNDGPVTFILER